MSDRILTASSWRNALRPDPSHGDFIAYADAFIERQSEESFHYGRRLNTTVRDFVNHIGQRLEWDDFTDLVLRSYNEAMKRTGLSANTRAQRLRAIKARAVRPSHEHPFRTFDMPRQTPTRAFALPEHDVKKLENPSLILETQEEWARDVFLLSTYCCGMRFSDAITLQWKDIVGDTLSYVMRKNKKHMKMRIQPPAMQILNRYRLQHPESSYVFPFDQGIDVSSVKSIYSRISGLNAYLNRHIKTAALKAGIDKQSALSITMHVSRHTFTRIAIDAGLPLMFVKKSLNHSKLSTTEAYIHDIEDVQLNESLQGLFGERRMMSSGG